MMLRGIALEGFRCFGPKIIIGPFDERMTVIHGPNGTGKSTLLLAIERTLFDRPDSADTEIQALVPWGADILPRVEIDLSTSEGTFRLSKAFGRRGEARLWKLDGGAPSLVKEGGSAVDWAREILGGQAPGRGATKPEHRGLGQVLFVAQGDVALPDRLGVGAGERLRAVVGGTAVDSMTRAIAEAIERQHIAMFTTGGKPKKGSDLQTLGEQAECAHRDLVAASAGWEQINSLQDAVAHAVDAVSASERKRDELLAEKQRVAPLVKQYRELVRRRDDAQQAHDAAEAAFHSIAERIDRITELRKRQGDLGAKLRSAESITASARQAQADAQRVAEEATRRRQEHEGREVAVCEAEGLAVGSRQLDEASSEIANLEPRLKRITDLRSEIGKLKEQAAQMPVLSGRNIKQLRDALGDERSAAEALDALRLHVTVRAMKRTSVEVGGKSIVLEAGATRKFAAEGSMTLKIGAVAEAAIAGPVTDVAGARDRLMKAKAAADALAAKLGSRIPEELEERKARRSEIDNALDKRSASLAELLGGGEDEPDEAIEEQLSSARGRRETVLRLHPEWKTSPPDPEGLAATAGNARQAFDGTARRLRREEDVARKAAESATHAVGLACDAEAQVRVGLEGVVGELRATAGDALTDEERERRRMEHSVALQSAKDALAMAALALDEFPEDPTTEQERIDRALQKVQDDLPGKSEELGRRHQTLEGALAAAPYARLASCEEKAAELDRSLARANLDAEAVALLHTLFAEEHAHATSLLFQPVADRVVPRLRRLVGSGVNAVEFDEQFKPAGVRLRGVESAVAPDDLSFGTRDQLSLLVRIALGEIVAGAGRLPIVLDDPLAHADASRLRRFVGILEEASTHLQVIVLTCRPDDYRALAFGRFLDIERTRDGLPPATGPASP